MEISQKPNFPKVFYCELCNIKTINKKDYSNHLNTKKHIKLYNAIIKTFNCLCGNEYKNYSRLWRHKKNCNGIKKEICNIVEEENEVIIKTFNCLCGNEYKNYSGLWRHKKICNGVEKEICDTVEIIEEKCDETLLKMVLKLLNDNKEIMQDNKEMKKQINDLCKNGISSVGNNNTITTTNNTNQTFNLQLFLNEKCKDAMNIGEFVDSFDIQLDDLEHVGRVGYIDGISRLITNRLKDIDVYKRPFHCSDLKRETMYVKDQDKWEKEEQNNPKLRKAIRAVSQKNMVKVVDWRDANPACRSSLSPLNDQFIKIVRQANGGIGEIADSEDKIMHRIAKEVGIDKK